MDREPDSEDHFSQVENNCKHFHRQEDASKLDSETELDRNEHKVVEAEQTDAEVHQSDSLQPSVCSLELECMLLDLLEVCAY